MQIVSLGENLHEMLKPVFWEKQERKISSICRVLNLPREWLKLNIYEVEQHFEKGKVPSIERWLL